MFARNKYSCKTIFERFIFVYIRNAIILWVLFLEFYMCTSKMQAFLDVIDNRAIEINRTIIKEIVTCNNPHVKNLIRSNRYCIPQKEDTHVIYMCKRWTQFRFLKYKLSEDSSDDDDFYDVIFLNDDGRDENKLYDNADDRYIRFRVLEAIKNGVNIDVLIKYLPECEINLSDLENGTFLHHAVKMHPYNINTIKELLKNGAKVNGLNCNLDTPLHTAVMNPLCDVDLVEVLLDSGANPNLRNHLTGTPLHLFLNKCTKKSNVDRNTEIIKCFLMYGANPNLRTELGYSPVIMAANAPYCHCSVIAKLIKHGADVNNSYNTFLLHTVLQKSCCSPGLVRLLLRLKPNFLKWMDIKSRTPLHYAVIYGSKLNVVEELIKMGANVNAVDNDLNTPLHLTRESNYSVIETLVKHGAKINALNKYNYTPLLEVINHELYSVNLTAVTAFINLGANLEMLDPKGKSAIDYALTNGSIQTNVVRLLLVNGAKSLDDSFLNDPHFYDCSNKEHIAILYLQFFIFRKSWDKYLMENPERMINFDSCGPELCHKLSQFRDNCIYEIVQMGNDWLTEDILLYLHMWDRISNKLSDRRLPSSIVKEVLVRMKSNKYPHCTDLLHAAIKRDELIDYLSLLIAYRNVTEVADSNQSVILDFSSTLYLTKFLNKETLLNLLDAFSDDF